MFNILLAYHCAFSTVFPPKNNTPLPLPLSPHDILMTLKYSLSQMGRPNLAELDTRCPDYFTSE